MSIEKVAVLGASDKPERYSYKAYKMLEEYGHEVYLVSPKHEFIEGHPVYSGLERISEKIDTLTLYVNPNISSSLKESILKLNPRRVIFNPGAENPALKDSIENAGISGIEACTLVLLKTKQF